MDDKWLGIVDCLGYLVCRKCNESGRGHKLGDYVFCAPHSHEMCDYCDVRLHSPGINPSEQQAQEQQLR